jgi:starvation-inducible outer membrane lipoprotein
MTINKLSIILTLGVALAYMLSGCSQPPKFETSKNGVIHLPMIPTDITFDNNVYQVDPRDVEPNTIGEEIGKTANQGFKVFKIKGGKFPNSIAILVRETDPTIYFKATQLFR